MATDYGSMVSLYLIPGMSVELSIPTAGGMGFFKPAFDTYHDGTKEYTLTNGFYEESEGVVGTLNTSTEAKLAVIYKHNKPEANAIWFIPDDVESKILFNVISVPIHDHSSIVQGGPAYGTYFSDDDVEE